jgi:hypothetical protein
MNEEQTSALYSIMLRTRETGLREKQLMKEVRRLHRLELALTLYRYIRRFYTAHAEGSATEDKRLKRSALHCRSRACDLQAFSSFKSLLLKHSLRNPPTHTDIFTPEQVNRPLP